MKIFLLILSLLSLTIVVNSTDPKSHAPNVLADLNNLIQTSLHVLGLLSEAQTLILNQYESAKNQDSFEMINRDMKELLESIKRQIYIDKSQISEYREEEIYNLISSIQQETSLDFYIIEIKLRQVALWLRITDMQLSKVFKDWKSLSLRQKIKFYFMKFKKKWFKQIGYQLNLVEQVLNSILNDPSSDYSHYIAKISNIFKSWSAVSQKLLSELE